MEAYIHTYVYVHFACTIHHSGKGGAMGLQLGMGQYSISSLIGNTQVRDNTEITLNNYIRKTIISALLKMIYV